MTPFMLARLSRDWSDERALTEPTNVKKAYSVRKVNE